MEEGSPIDINNRKSFQQWNKDLLAAMEEVFYMDYEIRMF